MACKVAWLRVYVVKNHNFFKLTIRELGGIFVGNLSGFYVAKGWFCVRGCL
jgi:hypothetical protein